GAGHCIRWKVDYNPRAYLEICTDRHGFGRWGRWAFRGGLRGWRARGRVASKSVDCGIDHSADPRWGSALCRVGLEVGLVDPLDAVAAESDAPLLLVPAGLLGVIALGGLVVTELLARLVAHAVGAGAAGGPVLRGAVEAEVAVGLGAQ